MSLNYKTLKNVINNDVMQEILTSKSYVRSYAPCLHWTSLKFSCCDDVIRLLMTNGVNRTTKPRVKYFSSKSLIYLIIKNVWGSGLGQST